MHLAKSYRGREVVRDVSLQMEGGEIVGLLGPNGAGKTTCFYMILGIIPADRGQVLLDGEDITHLPMHGRANRGIGYLPQEASVFRRLSVEDNILAILETRPATTRARMLEKLEELLQEFNLTHIRTQRGMSLSGGERRRVEIARSLASDPAFILLDEPFAGVDPISVHDIKEIVRHLQRRGIGVLITDHNVRETLSIVDRAYLIHQGRVLVSGTPADIVNNPESRRYYLGEGFKL
jgi:lipopolysaccharide export system ATP-binding protein